jgi:hypothetical protein
MQEKGLNYCTLSGIVLIAAFQVGCWTPKFNQGAITAAKPPVPSERVKIFHAGSAPGTNYEVLSALSCEGYTKEKYEAPMREAAGRIGADAVIGVRNFSAPRVIGARYQSGIAVRLLDEAKAGPQSEAKSGVAIVVLVEVPTKDSDELAALRETIELFAAANLHYRGYCPIYVNANLPTGKDAPSQATFELLNGTEASVCEKMLVLRLLRRGFQSTMAAQLHSRPNNAVIWSAEKETAGVDVEELLFEPVALVVAKALTAKSTQAVFKVVNKTLQKLPKNP